MDKIVDIDIKGERVIGGGVVLGAAGSHDDIILRITFDDRWDNLSKRVIWQNSNGENTIYTPLLTADAGKTNVYSVSVPFAPKQFEGKMIFGVKGFAIGYREVTSEPADFTANYSHYYTKTGDVYTALTEATTWDDSETYYEAYEAKAVMATRTEFIILPSLTDEDAEQEEEEKAASVVDTLHAAINDLEARKYEKDANGIPKSDLAQGVKDSLDLADSALQEHQDITGKVDKTQKIAGIFLSGDISGASLKTALSLDNVDNTSDADKPVSTAQQTALDGKVDKVSGKGLSEKDYTASEKTKLAGIETGAEVNVQSDWNQSNNQSDDYIKNKPTIPTKTSDLTNDSDFVSDASYVHTDNNYTSMEKSKLAGVEAGAEVNDVTSVAGKTGAVTLAKTDVGLDNVDNTSDANKPISNAQKAKFDKQMRLLMYGGDIAPTADEYFTFTALLDEEDEPYAYEIAQNLNNPFVTRDIVIPYEHNGKPVTQIADEGFKNCTTIEKFLIPKSITAIGASAFEGSANVGFIKIKIPDSVTDIGADAFKNCISLEDAYIPDSVTDVPHNNNIFSGNTNIIVHCSTGVATTLHLRAYDIEYTGNYQTDNGKIPNSALQSDVKEYIASAKIGSSGAPTTSTVADYVGQIYIDALNNRTYQCKSILGNTYTWQEILVNKSTTKTNIAIRGYIGGSGSVVIGEQSSTNADNSVILGYYARAYGSNNVIIGTYATINGSRAAQIGMGTNNKSDTLQFRDWRVIDSDGTIPPERITSQNWTDDQRLAVLSSLGCTVDNDGYVKWTAQPTPSE